MKTLPVVYGVVIVVAAGMAGAVGAMEGMDHDSLRSHWSMEDDSAFLFGMIAHHRGAVEMAEAIVDSTRDPQIQKWARGVLEDQRKEISHMELLVNQMGLQDSSGAGEAMRREMAAMTARPESSDADVNFIKMMIPHHADAISMSLPALVGSESGQIRRLAKDIIEEQAEEIYEFKKWLEENEESVAMI